MTSSAQKRSCIAASLCDAPTRNSFKSFVNSAAAGAACAWAAIAKAIIRRADQKCRFIVPVKLVEKRPAVNVSYRTANDSERDKGVTRSNNSIADSDFVGGVFIPVATARGSVTE